MNCYVHKEREVVGTCVHCGKFICDECNTEIKGKNYCKACVSELFDEKSKAIDKWEERAFSKGDVYMNAGGGGGASSSSSSSSSASSGHNDVARIPYPKQSVWVHIILAFTTYGIGNLIYYFYVRSKQKDWVRMYGG